MPTVTSEFVKRAGELAQSVPAMQKRIGELEKSAASFTKESADTTAAINVALDSLESSGAVTKENREKVAAELSSHTGAIRLVHRVATSYMKSASDARAQKQAAAMVNGSGVEERKVNPKEAISEKRAAEDAAFDAILARAR